MAGAVLARELAQRGSSVLVREERDHIAGNCFTDRDVDTGVMVHRYGPHIFHTDSDEAWAYVRRFGHFRPFVNRVKASIGGGLYPLPINLATLSQFFGAQLTPSDARALVANLRERIASPQNFEEQALSVVGRDLYAAFFEGYTLKQWGRSPTEVPASVFARLPVRFTNDDSYYADTYQAMPVAGYTDIIAGILDHPNISVETGASVAPGDRGGYERLFWSGPLDGFFGYRLGRLSYRTVHWTHDRHEGDALGTAVINYPETSVPYTRRIEHKFFAPWEAHSRTIVSTEFSKETEPGDTPYYPVRSAEDKALFSAYAQLAEATPGVSFIGRLGTYRYLDMDDVILDTLEFARAFDRQADLTFPPSVHVNSGGPA